VKRNIVPLLAIAFVVAIISTGIFYGLFAGKLQSSGVDLGSQTVVIAARNLERGTVLHGSDLRISEIRGKTALKGSLSKPEQATGRKLAANLQEGELVTERSLALSEPSSNIPTGMRAVSIRVSDSAALASSLQAGARVDLQVFSGGESNAQLRTILQNIEILNVNPQPEAGRSGTVPVVTILVRSQDADAVALADSSARLRVALRNPNDTTVAVRKRLAIAALFEPRQEYESGIIEAAANITPEQKMRAEELWVRAASASSAAIKELQSTGSGSRGGSIQAVFFQPGTLTGAHDIEVLSSMKVSGTGTRTVPLGGSGPNRLRIQFQAVFENGGSANLTIRPEIVWKQNDGVIESRTFEARVQDGRDVLLTGFLKESADRDILEKLFPGRAWTDRELVILVSSSPDRPAAGSAVAKVSRGR